MGSTGDRRPLLVVVGSGGVGKTTVAAALGLKSACEGRDTLVMTFDPSARLKDALGVGEAARDRVPAYLETDSERNIRFYEREGFSVRDEISVLGVRVWLMERAPADLRANN